MSIITISMRDTGATLFSGVFKNVKECAEAAVIANVSLAGADLRDADLSNANLDGANLRGALLDRCNLYGANLSEIDMSGASASDSDFNLACLADSRIHAVNFLGSIFGGTIIAGAHISDCVFSCPTVFNLAFSEAKLGPNSYIHDGRTHMAFAATPIVITGMPKRIVLLDDTALIGARVVAKPKETLEIIQTLYRAYA